MLTVTRWYRALALLTLAAALGGCKLTHFVFHGGEIRYIDFFADGLWCDASSVCTVNITQPNYFNFAVAVPHAGWELAGWADGSGSGYLFWCGPGKGTSVYRPGLEICEINNTGFAGNPGAEAAIASDALQVFVAPIFVQSTSGIPYTNTVSVGGRKWAQPADFVGLSWDGINAVCPGGACGPGAFLRGYDMEGWTWASVEDVNALANHYLAGAHTLGPGPDAYSDALSAVANMLGLTTAGPWQLTPVIFTGCAGCGLRAMAGLTATESATDTSRAHQGRFTLAYNFTGQIGGTIATTGTVAKSDNDLEHGAFFYRLP